MFEREGGLLGPEETRDEMNRLAGRSNFKRVEDLVSPELNPEEALLAREENDGKDYAELAQDLLLDKLRTDKDREYEDRGDDKESDGDKGEELEKAEDDDDDLNEALAAAPDKKGVRDIKKRPKRSLGQQPKYKNRFGLSIKPEEPQL